MERWDAKPSVLVGLIGRGIGASLSPALHEREGAEQGFRLVYRRIDLDVLGLGPEALPELLTAAERMGFAGVNVTFPCKQSVLPHLHALSEDARSLGAVNTVVFRDGHRTGHNTDAFGFAEGFRRGLPEAPRALVVMLGAGGAGSAVAHALLSAGAGHVAIHDLDGARADGLARSLCDRFGPGRAKPIADLGAAVAGADGVVNCTPVGMEKVPGTPLPPALLRPDLWVADVVYFPLETELLRLAREAGCRTIDGGGMAVFQAVEAFRLFTGLAPDAERMRRHFAAMTSSPAGSGRSAGVRQ